MTKFITAVAFVGAMLLIADPVCAEWLTSFYVDQSNVWR